MEWMKQLVVVLGLMVISSATAQKGIDRIDPPHWWVGMHNQELQLMVYGDNVANWSATIDVPGIRIDRSVAGDSENYMFLYLNIGKDVQPGSFSIAWKNAENRKAGRSDYVLHERTVQQAGYDNSDAICLITPDRFANGNPDNDEVKGLREGVSREDDHGRHGGDVAGIEAHLDYLDRMGFTAIWLNPILENDQPQWSYHGYSTTDYYRVDPRFGTNAEYRELADAARDRDMKVIMDMIMNHCGDEHPWIADPPTEDWINHGGTFAPTTHRRTSLRDPYAAQSDVQAFTDGWFVETMPDLNQRQPLLGDYLIQNTIWWIEYLGLGGIRMDTYPYSDAEFMSRWTCEIMAAYPEFNICGEEWSLNPAVLAYWQRDQVNANGYTSCLPGLLDFPLHDALIKSLTEEEAWHSNWVRLYEMLGNDFLYAHPDEHIIFPDNHDMSRIHTQLGDDARKTRLALVFVATMRGTPQFYYGTEFLMSNTGDDSHGNIRSDFPGGWEGDAVNAFTGEGLTAEALSFQTEFSELLQWRKTASAVHGGDVKHYVPEAGTYVYFRFNEDQKIMVILNQGDSSETLDLSRFHEVLPADARLTNALTGERIAASPTLEVPAWAAWILEVE